MKRDPRVRLHLWGVRGSCPTPQPGNLGYGGNTTCLEVRCGDQPPLIFDGGTGLRGLGSAIAKEFAANGTPARLFLTHFHWDHIQGIPFFAPLYQPGGQVDFYSVRPSAELRHIIDGQMHSPYFTARSAVRAELRYIQLQPSGVQIGDLLIEPFPLHHPDGASGYRIRGPGASIVFACDHEHGDEAIDRQLREKARDADVLIYDAQFTLEEYEQRRGWGHSNWLEATKIARDAGVRQLVLSHHDPWHDDGAITEIAAKASAEFENTTGAKEGPSVAI